MAKGVKAATFLKLVLVLSFLVAVSMADNRLFGFGFGKAKSAPVCVTVYGAEAGDSCFSVAQKFKLSADLFSAINPNLNCTAIFVGQWLCIDGTVN